MLDRPTLLPWVQELISSLPPDQRTIALSTIAERTKLPMDGVEFLLMKVGQQGVREGCGRLGTMPCWLWVTVATGCCCTMPCLPTLPRPFPLLHQTLALHLIEGVIDQVDGSVQVSWVQPRILTLPQVRAVGVGGSQRVHSMATALDS